MRARLAIPLAFALWPSIGVAQADPHPTLTGHVWNQAVNVPLPDANVRVWRLVGPKGWVIDRNVPTDGNGAWSVTDLPSGTYKVEAGGGTANPTNLGGRWYDSAAPFADGWAGEDADAFDQDIAYTDIDVVLPLNGGFDLQVTSSGGTPVGGIQARLMREADPRVHHNDQTRSDPHLGRFYMRGLVPDDDHLLALYDPSGAHGVTFAGPFTVTPGADTDGGTVQLVAAPDDTNEPNGAFDADGALSVDGEGLHDDPPVPWTSSDGRIDAAGDLDWYCWTAVAGDRYIVSTTSKLDVLGTLIANPWFDPMASVWEVTTGTAGISAEMRIEDDDSGPDRDARLDTLDIPHAGTLCAVVTAYGDADWTGAGQSVGTYDLRVEMGNRRPTVTVTEDGVLVPLPPSAIVAFEDAPIELVAVLHDPEGDTPWAEASFVDVDGLPVEGWAFDFVDDTGTFTWTPGPTAAEAGPYVLSIEAGDDELSGITDLIIAVSTVNIPPEMPELLAPIDGETVTTAFPELSVTNGFDVDEDPLSIEYEVYLDTADPPWQTALVPQDDSGVTSWTTPFVADATELSWRARTFDGDLYSAWTPFATFLVATFNDPPAVPVLDKPWEGEVVLVRRPALGVLDSADPENDPVSLTVQVAYDTLFTTPATTSDPVLEDDLGPTTSWTVDVDLPWGGPVFWRARATDSHGAASDWSEPSWFKVKDNVEPTIPTLAAPWGPTCADVVVGAIPTVITVNNAVDPEGEPLTLELELYDESASADALPVFTTSVPQASGALTAIPISYTFGEDGEYRVQVRASDGSADSLWATCSFWIDAVDSPTTGFAITEPTDDDTLASRITAVDAEVTNPLDADAHLPGGAMVLAWCLDGNDVTCDTDASTWSQLAFQDGLVTTFQVAGLVPDTDWILKACALDGTGVCTASDEVSFRTARSITDTGNGDDTGDDDTGDGGGCNRGSGDGCGCGGGPVGSWAWLVALAVISRRRR